MIDDVCFFFYLFDTCRFITGFYFISFIGLAGGQSAATVVVFLLILIAQHSCKLYLEVCQFLKKKYHESQKKSHFYMTC